MKMRKIEEDDCLMTREEFTKDVGANGLIDYDGSGAFATGVEVSDIVISPSALKTTKWPEWATHVCWCNK